MKMIKVMGVLGAISLAVGLSDVGGEMFSGLCRAFGAVLWIAGYIAYMLYQSEHIHGEDIEPEYEHYYVPHTVAHEVGFRNW